MAKKPINEKNSKIVELYKDSSITELLNDLVATGTWPIPEKPITGSRSVAIETVPLPERPRKLKGLLEELIREIGEKKVGEVLKYDNV
ncbi:MAG: hypothetical protein HOO91_21530 [Bacteroidales bacterium]|nr:hypothetical protein [Bacteroidales bacterium]